MISHFDQVNRILRPNTISVTAQKALRTPAMARGFQLTDLTSNPPRLQKMAANRRNVMPVARCLSDWMALIAMGSGIVCVHPRARRARIDPGGKFTFRLDMAAQTSIVMASAACLITPRYVTFWVGGGRFFTASHRSVFHIRRPPESRWPLRLGPLTPPGVRLLPLQSGPDRTDSGCRISWRLPKKC